MAAWGSNHQSWNGIRRQKKPEQKRKFKVNDTPAEKKVKSGMKKEFKVDDTPSRTKRKFKV